MQNTSRLKLKWIALLTGTIWLSGCATADYRSACPTVKTYSKAFNDDLAVEVEKAGPRVVEAISDYFVLRRQVIACR